MNQRQPSDQASPNSASWSGSSGEAEVERMLDGTAQTELSADPTQQRSAKRSHEEEQNLLDEVQKGVADAERLAPEVQSNESDASTEPPPKRVRADGVEGQGPWVASRGDEDGILREALGREPDQAGGSKQTQDTLASSLWIDNETGAQMGVEVDAQSGAQIAFGEALGGGIGTGKDEPIEQEDMDGEDLDGDELFDEEMPGVKAAAAQSTPAFVDVDGGSATEVQSGLTVASSGPEHSEPISQSVQLQSSIANTQRVESALERDSGAASSPRQADAVAEIEQPADEASTAEPHISDGNVSAALQRGSALLPDTSGPAAPESDIAPAKPSHPQAQSSNQTAPSSDAAPSSVALSEGERVAKSAEIAERLARLQKEFAKKPEGFQPKRKPGLPPTPKTSATSASDSSKPISRGSIPPKPAFASLPPKPVAPSLPAKVEGVYRPASLPRSDSQASLQTQAERPRPGSYLPETMGQPSYAMASSEERDRAEYLRRWEASLLEKRKAAEARSEAIPPSRPPPMPAAAARPYSFGHTDAPESSTQRYAHPPPASHDPYAAYPPPSLAPTSFPHRIPPPDPQIDANPEDDAYDPRQPAPKLNLSRPIIPSSMFGAGSSMYSPPYAQAQASPPQHPPRPPPAPRPEAYGSAHIYQRAYPYDYNHPEPDPDAPNRADPHSPPPLSGRAYQFTERSNAPGSPRRYPSHPPLPARQAPPPLQSMHAHSGAYKHADRPPPPRAYAASPPPPPPPPPVPRPRSPMHAHATGAERFYYPPPPPGREAHYQSSSYDPNIYARQPVRDEYAHAHSPPPPPPPARNSYPPPPPPPSTHGREHYYR